MDIILSLICRQSCLVHFDDVIVFSPSVCRQISYVEEIFSLLNMAVVTFKHNKCAFLKREVDYLGHTILTRKHAAALVTTIAIAIV